VGQQDWEYSCCDCSPGSVPETPGACPQLTCGSKYFVHCTEADENLVFSGVTQSYVCDSVPSHQRACRMAQAVETGVGVVNLLATVAEAMCPIKDIPAVVTALLQDAMAVMIALSDKSTDSGILSAGPSAALSVFATLKAFLLTAAVAAALPEEGAVVVGLAAYYAMACYWAGVIGVDFCGCWVRRAGTREGCVSAGLVEAVGGARD
jgi:hypothetical protein